MRVYFTEIWYLGQWWDSYYFIVIEPKIAELVRFHGLRRARYRGLARVNLQCLFTALVVNIKRWFNLIRGRSRAPTLSPA